MFVGLEAGRFDAHELDNYVWGVSVVTLGELRLGVLRAKDPEVAEHRLSTYQLAQRLEPLHVDESVSDAWARLVAGLREAGRKAPINDTWIAATALAHDVPILTQDADYSNMPYVKVITV